MQAMPRNARIDVENVDHVVATIGPSAVPRIAIKERTCDAGELATRAPIFLIEGSHTHSDIFGEIKREIKLTVSRAYLPLCQESPST